MMPNTDQWKMLIRWVLTWTGGIVGGWLAAKANLTPDQLAQVSGFFSSETVVTIILSLGGLLWGLLAHTKASTVSAAAKLPEVAAVEVAPTPAGIALKTAVGSTPDAQVKIAK